MLGLYHVPDPDALMTGSRCQGTGFDRQRLMRRAFRMAPLTFAVSDLTVWSLGGQHPIRYLHDTPQ